MSGNRRRFQAALVVAAAVAAVIVLIVVSSGSSVNPAKKLTASTETATQKMVASWVAGTAQHATSSAGVVWGDLNAPVTDREYIDLQCSACDEHFVGLSRTGGSEIQLIPLIRAGKLKVEFLPLPTVTPTATMLDAEWGGLLAAARQGTGVQYLFTNYVFQPPEGTFTLANVLDTGKATLGLNYATWNLARTNPAFGDQIFAALKRDRQLGYRSTPTSVFSNTTGRTVALVGVYPASAYQQAIRRLGG